MTDAPVRIPLHRANCSEAEMACVQQAMASGALRGGGPFTRRCEGWLHARLGRRALLTSSCTHALEMAALLLDIQPGDEVICPAYTFVSTANAFALRGARIVFVDIDPHSLCIDVDEVQAAITPRTRLVVPVHYAGRSCDMARLMALAEHHGFHVVEDAAAAFPGSQDGRMLGTLGHLGTFSFHETKNLTAGGEGGALVVNDERLYARAEILRDKGTDTQAFRRGEVSRYRWQDLGSSYLMSELQAAFLWAQFERADTLQAMRAASWRRYRDGFASLASGGLLLPPGQEDPRSAHNHHSWYLRLPDQAARDSLLACGQRRGIQMATHYEPLHQSPGGLRFGRVAGRLPVTAAVAATLVRLPLWSGIPDAAVEEVVSVVTEHLHAAH